MAAAPPAAAGPPAIVPPLMQLGPPMWEELFAAPERIFALPDTPYGVVSAALFSSLDPPEVLLQKLEQTALESLVVVALVSDEDPDWITLLKSPRRFVGSLVHPTPLDGLIYGFSGPDAHALAAVHTSLPVLLRLALLTTSWMMLLPSVQVWRAFLRIRCVTRM